MPKIPPRESVREHPLYRAAMAAQHSAYQLMRDVPASAKADATRLHVALVHATTWATAIVDADVPVKDRSAARAGLGESIARAQEMLGPLAALANDAGIPQGLEEKLEELRKLKSEGEAEGGALRQAEPAA